MNSSSQLITVTLQQGVVVERTVQQLLEQLEPAEYSWIEPRPQLGLRSCQTLFSGQPERRILAEVELEEARLFYSAASLHLLATHSGVQWSLLQEKSEMIVPLEALSDPVSRQAVECTCKVSGVLLRRDLERFGLEANNYFQRGLSEKMRLIEYWKGVQQIGWRIR